MKTISILVAVTCAVTLSTHAQPLAESTFTNGANGIVYALSLQPDGKIVAAGGFNTLAGQPQRFIGRLNADGSYDASFAGDANGEVFTTAVQRDGKVLAGGGFNTISGLRRENLGRFNANGSADATFNAQPNNYVFALAVQPDGKILVGGYFTAINGTTRNRIARLNADGTLDLSFNPDVNAEVFGIALQTDGKILIGGVFSTVGGAPHGRIARLNPEGSVDTNFNASANSTVRAMIQRPDGCILAAGGFGFMNGVLQPRIALLDTNGVSVAAFNANAYASAEIFSMALQLDGRIIVGGGFEHINGVPRSRLGRFNTDGTLDLTWNPGANGQVRGIALQNDGRLLVGGLFSTLGGDARGNLGRILADGPVINYISYIPGTGANAGLGTVTWVRGGVSSEADYTILETSGDGVNFNGSVNGTRLGNGWQFNSVPMPLEQTTYLRARGFTRSGQNNGSGSIEQSPTNFFNPDIAPVLSLLPGPETYAAANPPVILGATATVTDVDSPIFNPGSLTVTNIPGGLANDILSVVHEGSGAGQVGVTNGTVYFGGLAIGSFPTSGAGSGLNGAQLTITFNTDNATLAAVQAAVRRLGFSNSSPLPATADRVLRITVADNFAKTSSQTNTVNVLNVPPFIVTPPASLTVLAGSPALFSVTAAGTSPLNYEWRRGTTVVQSGASASLSLSPALLTDAGDYTVVVSNGAGSVTSAPPATLTVLLNTAPSLTLSTMPITSRALAAWGNDTYGQTTIPAGVTNVAAVAAGVGHTLALLTDGTVVAWGDNTFGQAAVPPGLSGVRAIGAGMFFSLAAKNDGSVVAWGRNNSGQTTVPVGLTDVIAVAGGEGHALALRSDGTVAGWGTALGGELGVVGATDVSAIAAGRWHSLLLKNDGTVTGAGTYRDGGAAVTPPAGLTNVRAIAAGEMFSLALRSDGTVTAWGGEYVQTNSLWDGVLTVPAELTTGLSNVTAIAAGYFHAMALKADGMVTAWGGNAAGQATVPTGLANVVAIAGGWTDSFAITNAVTAALLPISVNEDAVAQTVLGAARNISPGPASESWQVVSFVVTNDNNGLFLMQPAVSASGTLTFTPAADSNGTATVTVIAHDNGGTASGGADTSAPQTFTITVAPVNDPPSFNLSGTNLTVVPADGAVTRANWATNIMFGPANEAPQSVTFTVTNSNNALFAIGGQPAIDNSGALTFTPAPGAAGVVTVGVTATDSGGASTSASQTFTITFANTKIFVGATSPVVVGDIISVPIYMVGDGTENGVSFTITYNRPVLSFYGSVTVESGSGLTLYWKEPWPDMNKVGIVVSKAGGTAFPAGTNLLVWVTFQAPGTAPITTPLGFSSAVVLQQVADTNANVKPYVQYVPGSVTIVPTSGYEGDVTPRPNGSGTVTVSDVVQVGRFAAGYDTAAAGGEFQRADCAPRSTGGDGFITVADYVQAGRYAAGLDALQTASGPTSGNNGAMLRPAQSISRARLLGGGARSVQVGNMTVQSGRFVVIPVTLNAQGTENSLGFSLNFNPAQLQFISASTGNGMPGLSLIQNTLQATAGRVGLIVSLSPGAMFDAGPREVALVAFRVVGSVGTAAVNFGDMPVWQEVVDAQAGTLTAGYNGGTVTILAGNAGLRAQSPQRLPEGGMRLLITPADGAQMTAGQLARLEVWTAPSLTAPAEQWTLLPNALVLTNGEVLLQDGTAGNATLRFYKIIER